jgi:hypothetical protein
MSKRIILLVAFALTFCAGVIVSEARHHFGAPRFTPTNAAEPDVLDLVAALRAKGIRLEPVAIAPYRSPAKAAYLCAEVPPSDTFANLMFNTEGLRDWQGIVFVELHGSPLNAAATVIGPYHLWGEPQRGRGGLARSGGLAATGDSPGSSASRALVSRKTSGSIQPAPGSIYIRSSL